MTRHHDIHGGSDSVQFEPDVWRAQLELDVRHRAGKSVVAGSSQRGPLTIQKPFYPENDVCHLYLLHPPAGVVGGDRLALKVNVADEGSVLLTTPGATKFYRTNGRQAEQHQHFSIEDGASLEWLPQETIYFPDADARLETVVHLAKEASFIGWEIHCLGLPANGKDFASGKARIGLTVIKEGKPFLIESLKISEEKHQRDDAFLRGRPVVGSLIATGADQQLCDSLREQLPEGSNGEWGATLLDDVLIVRYLGTDTCEVRKLFIRAWEIIRPQILGRKAALPRIWAT